MNLEPSNPFAAIMHNSLERSLGIFIGGGSGVFYVLYGYLGYALYGG
jgi:hypothetical protein